MQRESKYFVTMENLEEKIKQALENERDYNFALSLASKKVI